MTTYELAKMIRKAIVNRAAEVMAYTNWSDEFAASEIRGIPAWIKDSANFKPLDLTELTKEELIDIGCGMWDEESNLYLLPLWTLPFLPDEIELGCISGETKKFKRDEIDNDCRFGCLAYGVIKK